MGLVFGILSDMSQSRSTFSRNLKNFRNYSTGSLKWLGRVAAVGVMVGLLAVVWYGVFSAVKPYAAAAWQQHGIGWWPYVAKPTAHPPLLASRQRQAALSHHPRARLAAEPTPTWHRVEIKKHDTLSQVFARLGLPIQSAVEIVGLAAGKALLTIKPGELIELGIDANQRLIGLKYKIDVFQTLRVTRSPVDSAGDFPDDSPGNAAADFLVPFPTDSPTDSLADSPAASPAASPINSPGHFVASITTRRPHKRIRAATTTIKSSLLAAAEQTAIGFSTTYAFANLFIWQVDFAKDIRAGDQFSVIFEEYYLDNIKVKEGPILAAELITGHKTLRAIRHVGADAAVEYYAPNGASLKSSFLRMPLEYGRITSKYSARRLHPILKRWRAHKGVDYGAPMNTPVLATGDGVVKYTGTQSGYGRTVIIRHGNQFETLYAHLNRVAKATQPGARVKQGDVIGYVGRTGWATGPHLHYEFRIDGQHKNPLSVPLPRSAAIDKKYRAAFTQQAQHWGQQLDALRQEQVARQNLPDALPSNIR